MGYQRGQSGYLLGHEGLLAVMLQDEKTFRRTYGKSYHAWSDRRLQWEESIGFKDLSVNQRFKAFFHEYNPQLKERFLRGR